MEAHNLPSLNWSDGPWSAWGTVPGDPGVDGAEDGAGSGCNAAVATPPQGGALMAFLTDFRTAQHAEEEAARLSAAARRGAGPAGGRARRLEEARAAERPAAVPEDPFQGSEVPVAPDWWLATDGKWYRPELHPDAQVADTAEQTANADDPATPRRAASAHTSAQNDSGVTAIRLAETAPARAAAPQGSPVATAAPEDRRRERRLLPGRPGRGLRPTPGPACA